MKTVIDISLGKSIFTIDEDAYNKLQGYLRSFGASLPNKQDRDEVMEDIELRIAELFQKDRQYQRQVVDIKMVDTVISLLGNVEGNSANETRTETKYSQSKETTEMKTSKKLYRNPDDKKLGGVCSGLAIYFDVDPTIVRLIFLALFFGGGSGFLVYLICWIVIGEANTVAKKLEMRGIPATAENIKNFSEQNYN